MIQGWGFHATPGPLAFRASVVPLAEFTVDVDWFSNLCGGLEISKLHVDSEIRCALAKKGITKLFPIQVTFKSPLLSYIVLSTKVLFLLGYSVVLLNSLT